MRSLTLLSAVLAGLTSYAAAASLSCSSNLLVGTNEGKVRGVIPEGFPGVRHFLGIPYAKPPVNDLRFAPAQPAERRSGVFDASRFPPSCPQV